MPIYDQYNATGYKISIDNFNIVGKEDQNQASSKYKGQ